MTLYLMYMASPILIYIIMNLVVPDKLLSDKNTKKWFLIICGIVMVLMIGLRHPDNGSGDTRYYYKNWSYMSTVAISDLKRVLAAIDMEKGYLVCVWILSHIFPHPQMALVLSGIFFAISICHFVYKNSDDVVMPLLVFNCLGLFNFVVQGLRQSVAMCICLWSLEQCKKKNFIGFTLLVLLATSIHASAAVFFIVYFLRNLKLDLKGISIFSCCVAVGFIFLPTLFELMNKLLNEDYKMGIVSEQGGIVAIFIYLVIIVFALFFKDNKNSNRDLYIYISLIGLITFMMRNSISQIASRISYYFQFAQMIILSNSIKAVSDRSMRALIVMITAVLCLGVAIHKASYTILIPYNFFWFNIY